MYIHIYVYIYIYIYNTLFFAGRPTDPLLRCRPRSRHDSALTRLPPGSCCFVPCRLELGETCRCPLLS